MYLETCDESYIFRCEIRHQHSAHWPVDHIHTRDVTAADGKVVTLIGTGRIESGQVAGRMGEVGIHLEDVVVTMFQTPFETCDVGSAQSLFSCTLQQEQTVGKLCLHQSLHNGGSAVRGTIINHKNVETFLQCKYCTDNLLNILLLVVSRYDNYAVALVHVRYMH